MYDAAPKSSEQIGAASGTEVRSSRNRLVHFLGAVRLAGRIADRCEGMHVEDIQPAWDKFAGAVRMSQ